MHHLFNLRVGKIPQKILDRMLDRFFSRPFKLAYFRKIFEYLQGASKRTDVIAPYTTLVQSSGVGKTRTMAEMLKLTHGLYTCCRPSGDVKSVPGVSEWFKSFRKAISDDDVRKSEHVEKLVIACSEMLIKWLLEQALGMLTADRDMPLDERYQKLLDASFYGKKRPSLLQDNLPSLETNLSIVKKMASTSGQTAENVATKLSKITCTVTEVSGNTKTEKTFESFRMTITAILDKIATACGKKPKNRGLFVLAFDEVDFFLSQVGSENTEIFRLFRRAISELQALNLIFIFAGTNSAVTNFFNPRFYSSARDPTRSCMIHPIVLEFDFDSHLLEGSPGSGPRYLPFDLSETVSGVVVPTSEGTGTEATSLAEGMESSYFVKRLTKFSRALWHDPALIDYSSPDSGLADILRLADIKLGVAENINDNISLTLLAICTGLVITSVESLATKLVKSFSAVLVHLDLTPERSVSYVTYPSEPVFACAAMRTLSGKNAVRSLADLKGMLDSGYTDRGGVGEVVARLILALAKDAAYRPSALQDSRPIYFSVPLAMFLESLFFVGEFPFVEDGRYPVAPEVLDRFSEMKAALGDWWVNFNHYILWTDRNDKKRDDRVDEEASRSIDEGTLRYVAARGGAYISPRNYPGIDAAIPCFKSNGQVGYVSIQIKNQKDQRTPSDREVHAMREGGRQLFRGMVPLARVYMDIGPLTDPVRISTSRLSLKRPASEMPSASEASPSAESVKLARAELGTASETSEGEAEEAVTHVLGGQAADVPRNVSESEGEGAPTKIPVGALGAGLGALALGGTSGEDVEMTTSAGPQEAPKAAMPPPLERFGTTLRMIIDKDCLYVSGVRRFPRFFPDALSSKDSHHQINFADVMERLHNYTRNYEELAGNYEAHRMWGACTIKEPRLPWEKKEARDIIRIGFAGGNAESIKFVPRGES